MKVNNKAKKKTVSEIDDQVEEYEDPEKWYEQVRSNSLFFPLIFLFEKVSIFLPQSYNFPI